MTQIAVNSVDDIFPEYKHTLIGSLLAYHNLGQPYTLPTNDKLLIGMCMDFRKHLNFPRNFAYVMRAGGANISQLDFQVSYAIACGGVRAIALIGHTDCGMVDLMSKHKKFVDGLVDHAGWERQHAEAHFMSDRSTFEIGDEVDFVVREAARLKQTYPPLLVAPLLYKVEDGRLYQIKVED